MVIITGASGGIGNALAQKVVLSGQICCAVIRDVNKPNTALLRSEISNLFVVDYRLNSFIGLLPDTVEPQISHVTLVLNAFDIYPIKKASELIMEEVRKNIEFNIAKQIEITTKAFELSRYVNVPFKIVYLDSGAAYQPISGWSMYCAGKAYMGMFLRVFSQENDIPLVLYDPGVVDTKMQEAIRNSDKQHFPLVEKFINFHLSKQLHSTSEIAEDIWGRYLQNWNAAELREHFADRT